jgi:undecaprenyl-phosphate galactose phosphotransferase
MEAHLLQNPLPPIQVQRDPLKRLFDFVVSFLVLFLTFPLGLLIAIAIKTTSRGPVFYKSPRLGRGGRIIGVWKFRSMYIDADSLLPRLLAENPEMKREWELYRKLKIDPRITPLGLFLRRTSLDEWPQFWNVFLGEMSLVGPRAQAIMGSWEQFVSEMPRYYGDQMETILSVRPGITGLWQVSGRSEIPLEERIRLEASYALKRSFWKDLEILFKTIPAVLATKGAC